MTTDTHCPRCDRVPASGEAHDAPSPAYGGRMCWAADNRTIPAVDWRARALAAMAERDGAWNAAIEAAAKEVADTDVVTRTLGYSTFDDGIDTLRNARQAVEALRRPNATPAPAAREVEWRRSSHDAPGDLTSHEFNAHVDGWHLRVVVQRSGEIVWGVSKGRASFAGAEATEAAAKAAALAAAGVTP
jgi:hypothetical protein